MPRQNIMAFAPVKLVLLGVLLVEVASARYDFGNYGESYGGSPFQSLGCGAGSPAARMWLEGQRIQRNADDYGGLGYAGLGYGGFDDGFGYAMGYGHGEG